MNRFLTILTATLFVATLSSACVLEEDGGGGGGHEMIVPVDGTYSGNGIEFEVSGNGASIRISYADYGSCSGGGCTSEAYATCGRCEGAIDARPGETSFYEPVMGCSGEFDSDTTAHGTCSEPSDCGCTMVHEWTAELE